MKLKYILIFFMMIFLITFLCSSIFLETDWFKDEFLSYENNKIFVYLQSIRFISFLFLISFLIAYGNYFSKIKPKESKNKFIYIIGVFFAVSIILKLLVSYYLGVYINKEIKYDYNIKAENTIIEASRLYYDYGISIEYYDSMKKIQKFKPSASDLEIRNLKEIVQMQLHIIPLKIVFSFLMIIISLYVSNFLAKKYDSLEK